MSGSALWTQAVSFAEGIFEHLVTTKLTRLESRRRSARTTLRKTVNAVRASLRMRTSITAVLQEEMQQVREWACLTRLVQLTRTNLTSWFSCAHAAHAMVLSGPKSVDWDPGKMSKRPGIPSRNENSGRLRAKRSCSWQTSMVQGHG